MHQRNKPTCKQVHRHPVKTGVAVWRMVWRFQGSQVPPKRPRTAIDFCTVRLVLFELFQIWYFLRLVSFRGGRLADRNKAGTFYSLPPLWTYEGIVPYLCEIVKDFFRLWLASSPVLVWRPAAAVVLWHFGWYHTFADLSIPFLNFFGCGCRYHFLAIYGIARA